MVCGCSLRSRLGADVRAQPHPAVCGEAGGEADTLLAQRSPPIRAGGRAGLLTLCQGCGVGGSPRWLHPPQAPERRCGLLKARSMRSPYLCLMSALHVRGRRRMRGKGRQRRQRTGVLARCGSVCGSSGSWLRPSSPDAPHPKAGGSECRSLQQPAESAATAWRPETSVSQFMR